MNTKFKLLANINHENFLVRMKTSICKVFQSIQKVSALDSTDLNLKVREIG